MVRQRKPRASAPGYGKPRRGWERATVRAPQPSRVRETFRADAPSPREEILAKADAELGEPVAEPAETDESTATDAMVVDLSQPRPTVVCF